MSARVRVLRGGTLESAHRVHVAVCDASGRRLAGAGRPERVTFYRSSAKLLQALPLVDDGVVDRFGLGAEELAICCASHNAEPAHLEAARSILDRAGRSADDLACGPHPPLRREVGEALLRDGVELSSIHSNCSGKHAGMIALAVARGWPVEGYHEADHPVQGRMRDEIARWAEVAPSSIRTGTDGCGVVSFAVPLAAMAASFARLARAAADGEKGPSRVVKAVTEHPFLVAGTGRLDTDLMEATDGTVFAKTGAEGVHCVGLPGRGVGIAVKVEDGARRAADPALVRVLELVGALTPEQLERLADHRRPAIRNTRGEEVGIIEADFELGEAG